MSLIGHFPGTSTGTRAMIYKKASSTQPEGMQAIMWETFLWKTKGPTKRGGFSFCGSAILLSMCAGIVPPPAAPFHGEMLNFGLAFSHSMGSSIVLKERRKLYCNWLGPVGISGFFRAGNQSDSQCWGNTTSAEIPWGLEVGGSGDKELPWPGESLHLGKGTGQRRKAKGYQSFLSDESLSAFLSIVHLFGIFFISFWRIAA